MCDLETLKNKAILWKKLHTEKENKDKCIMCPFTGPGGRCMQLTTKLRINWRSMEIAETPGKDWTKYLDSGWDCVEWVKYV